MTSSRPSLLPARLRGLVVILTGLATVALTGLVAPPAVAADPAQTPRSGAFTVTGAGYGHGYGMSQYGAYGAARQGRSWREILAFYYPGTVLGQLRPTTIDVWLSVDDETDLQVRPAAGLTLRSGSTRYALPVGSAYRTWRVTRSGSGYRLSYRGSGGSWKTRSTPLGTATWSFSTTAGVVPVVLPSGAVREYRGTVSFVRRGTAGRTVNRVGMESYLRSVVPSEMPTSWHPEAVRVQAVAARSYAARLIATSEASGYDICDTVNCQVYSGLATTSGGRRLVRETPGGDAAVRATAGTAVLYGGRAAFTQFSSSNGGAMATGSQPYLRAGRDPYDEVVKSQRWTRTISASQIAARWPSVGTVRSVQVTARDGSGRWGGRVRTLVIRGTRGSVTVTGTRFQYAFGMRSNLFTLGGSPAGGGGGTIAPGARYATFPRSYAAASRVDLTLVSPAGELLRYPASAARLGGPVAIGSGFSGFTHVVNAGDWNGDGYQDLVARTRAGRLLLFRGGSSGRLSAGTDLGVGGDHRMVTSLGDANGDRFPDLAVVTRAGAFALVYGDGRAGTRSVRTFAGGGWGNRDWLRGPGDFDGDGRVDLLSRVGPVLYLNRGTATGFRPAVSLGSGWSGLSSVTAVGDLDGDRRPDLVGRTTTGQLRLYRGDGTRLRLAGTYAGSFRGTRFAI